MPWKLYWAAKGIFWSRVCEGWRPREEVLIARLLESARMVGWFGGDGMIGLG
jgi:hypothetical protein